MRDFHSRWIAAALSLAVGLSLGACAGGDKGPGFERDGAADAAGEAPLAGSIPASRVYPTGPLVKRYRVLSLPEREEVEKSILVTHPPDEDGVVRSVTSTISENEEERTPRASHLKVGEDGAIKVLKVETSSEAGGLGGGRRIFRYEPPLTLMPGELGPEEVFEEEVSMIQLDANEPTRTVGEGKVRRRVRQMRPGEAADIFSDASEALRSGVVTEMRVTFGPAVDTRTEWRLLDPTIDAGAVRKRLDRRLTVLGLPQKDEQTLSILESHQRELPEDDALAATDRGGGL